MKILASPYPIAVPGKIKRYHFDRKTNTFTLEFSAETGSERETEIYAPSVPSEVLSDKKPSIKKIGDSEAVLVSVAPVKGENKITVIL